MREAAAEVAQVGAHLAAGEPLRQLRSPAGGQPKEGEPRVRPSPSAELTILDALGALGAANAIVTVISGKDPLQNFSDLVLGGLRIDPEARLRFRRRPPDNGRGSSCSRSAKHQATS